MAKAKPYSDQKNWSNTYLTDPKLVKALGPFAIDVCCPRKMPWSTARRLLVEGRDDGLTAKWGRGRAWMNPPYRRVLQWTRRLKAHGHGIALLNGRSVETQATHELLRVCSGVFLPDRRLTFYKVTGKPFAQKWFPSILIGLDAADAKKLAALPSRGFPGVFLRGPRFPGTPIA